LIANMDTTLRELKDFASTALELKHKDAPKDAVSAAAVQGSLLLLRCREQSRQAALEADRMRAKASGQREDLDQATLQLHNLVYEQQVGLVLQATACLCRTRSYV
jgi:hypothetical protein